MKVLFYYSLIILFITVSVSCSGTTGTSDETKVDPIFLELNIKKISVNNILITYKYQDQREREWTEEEESSFGIYNIVANKEGDIFSGKQDNSDGFAKINSSVIVSLDSNVKPRSITYIQINEFIEVTGQYEVEVMLEMENIEINASELDGTTINLKRNGQAVCGYLKNFVSNYSSWREVNGKVLSYKCIQDSDLQIEIIGNSGSQ